MQMNGGEDNANAQSASLDQINAAYKVAKEMSGILKKKVVKQKPLSKRVMEYPMQIINPNGWKRLGWDSVMALLDVHGFNDSTSFMGRFELGCARIYLARVVLLALLRYWLSDPCR